MHQTELQTVDLGRCLLSFTKKPIHGNYHLQNGNRATKLLGDVVSTRHSQSVNTASHSGKQLLGFGDVGPVK